MLILVSLLVLVLITNTCLAVQQCQAPGTLFGVPYPPLPSDCRQALAHMPIRDVESNNAAHDHDRPLDPSNPFFPRAEFRYDTCVISIGYLEAPRNMNHTEVPRFPNADQREELEVSLTEEDVFNLWTILRDAGERLVQECVDRQKTGVEWNPLNFLALPYAWYRIDIRSEEQISRSSSLLKAEQRLAMRDHHGGWYYRQFIMPDRFKMAFLNLV